MFIHFLALLVLGTRNRDISQRVTFFRFANDDTRKQDQRISLSTTGTISAIASVADKDIHLLRGRRDRAREGVQG